MDSLAFGSLCVHELPENRTTRPHELPIYATSSFVFETLEQGIDMFSGAQQGHTYSRYGNPTVDAAANKIALLEAYQTGKDAMGLFTASGMAAIQILTLSLLKSGDKILTQGNLYGGTTELFQKVLAPLGIEAIYTDLTEAETARHYFETDPSIRLLYLETPANPTMACVDIAALSGIARHYSCHTAVDNTFCTPYLQQPLALGADFVVHSTTKFLNGHGTSIAGAIVGSDIQIMRDKVWPTLKISGANGSPWDAWIVHNGLKTLEVRMDRHCSNAMAVAHFLEQHPAVSKVNYNGLTSHPFHELAKKQMRNFGAMLSFEMRDGLDAAIAMVNRLRFCTMAPTLGDVDTLVLHPATMSHRNIAAEIRQAQGITDGLIRVSVGIESERDIISDFEQALSIFK